MDMCTMRLRRTGSDRGQRVALPTAASFAHLPTAFHHEDDQIQRKPMRKLPSRGQRETDFGLQTRQTCSTIKQIAVETTTNP
jgi:hypothetical protein